MAKRIFVISGPSGAGKTTLMKMLMLEFQGSVSYVISSTTRSMRNCEVDGLDYHFISVSKFLEMVEKDQFIEYVECYGNYYGTSIHAISAALSKHDSCIMDLEWNGARNLLQGKFMADIKKIGILILPPSISALKSRLITRASETEESLNVRISKSFSNEGVGRYDCIIINSDIDSSYKQLREEFAKEYG